MTMIVSHGVGHHVCVEGKGEPILFLHGFPLDHSMWREQIDFFSSEYQVIAPDFRGFGQSDIVDGVSSMEQLADDMDGVLTSLGVTEPVVVCGLSMGGYVAWQMLKRHRRRVKAAIICDSRTAADSKEAGDVRRRLVNQVLADGIDRVIASMMPKLFHEEAYAYRAQLVGEARAIIRRQHPVGVAAALRGLATRPDMTDWVASIDVPTRLIVGTGDRITPPAEMKQIAEKIPRASLIEVPEAGHLTPLENPNAFNDAVLSFLRDLSGTPVR